MIVGYIFRCSKSPRTFEIYDTRQNNLLATLEADYWEEAFLWWLSDYDVETYQSWQNVKGQVSTSICSGCWEIDYQLKGEWYSVRIREITKYLDDGDCVTVEDVLQHKQEKKETEAKQGKIAAMVAMLKKLKGKLNESSTEST